MTARAALSVINNESRIYVVSSSFLAERFKYLIGVFGHIHLVEDLHDLAVLIYQKCRTVYSHVLFTVHALFGPNAVFFDNFFVGIGHEVERQTVL